MLQTDNSRSAGSRMTDSIQKTAQACILSTAFFVGAASNLEASQDQPDVDNHAKVENVEKAEPVSPPIDSYAEANRRTNWLAERFSLVVGIALLARLAYDAGGFVSSKFKKG